MLKCSTEANEIAKFWYFYITYNSKEKVKQIIIASEKSSNLEK